MKASESFQAKYFKVIHLNGREVTLVICDYAREKVGPDGEIKPVLYFRGHEKGLVLNKANNETLILAYGDETDDWVDQAVVLYTVQTEYQGKPTTGIRLKVPPRQKSSQPPPLKDALDDEVGF